MSISNTDRVAGPYTGNGVAVSFPFGFKVFQTSDVRVVRTDADGVEYDLTEGSEYTVTLNASQDDEPGGVVEMSTAPGATDKLTLTSRVEPLQPARLTNNGGFYPRVIEAALDRLTILQQQTDEVLGRTLRAPSGAFNTLPSPAGRRGGVLGFNDEGGPVMYPRSGAIGDASGLSFLPAGAGAVPSTIEKKLRECVSVKDFGAVADGVTNDRAAFQAAVDHVQSIGGGAVLVPDGVYLVSGSAITISGSNVVLYASGYAKLLKGSAINCVNVTGSSNEVRGLLIDGQFNSGNGILVTGNNNTIWFNRVVNNGGVGIGQNGRLTGASGNTICFNSVDNITGNTGISTNAASYGMVAFNRISRVQAEGLANNEPFRCMYFGNMVTSSSAGGVAGIGTDAAVQTVWGFNMSYANKGRGFKAKEHNGGSSKCALIGNLIANNKGDGLHLENNTEPAGQTGTYSITSNTATVTVAAGHRKAADDVVRLVFSGAAPDGEYSVSSVVSDTVFTASVVTADESGTVTVGAVDPSGNYAKEWTIIGNVTTGNAGVALNIDTPDAHEPLVVVASGQSNMRGFYPGGSFDVNPDVQIWNGSAFVTADLQKTLITTQSGALVGDEGSDDNGNNNWAVAFCHRLRGQTGRKVYLILDCLGGQSISQWVGSGTSSPLYVNLKTAVTAGLAALSRTRAYLFLWGLGENDSDAGRTQAQYYADAMTLLAQLRSESWMQATTPFIASGLLPSYYPISTDPVQLALQQLNTDSDAFTMCADVSDLVGTGKHFDGPSLYELGYNRAWNALASSELALNYLDRGGLQAHQIAANVAPISQTGPALDDTSRTDTRPVAFIATTSAGALNVTGNGVYATIPFDTVTRNRGNGFMTSENKFVAPRSGYYNFSAACRVTGATGATIGSMRLNVAGALYEAPMTAVSADSERRGLIVINGVYLNKGGSVTALVMLNGIGANTADINNAATTTWFTGSAL